MVPPVQKVQMLPVSQIKWASVTPKTLITVTKPWSEEDLNVFLDKLKGADQVCPLMAVRSPYNELFIPKNVHVTNDDETDAAVSLYLINVNGKTFNPNLLKNSLTELQNASTQINKT